MKTISLELPDKIAGIFEALPQSRKAAVTMLATILAQSKSKSTDKLFDKIDKRVASSGISEMEIDQLLEEIS